MPLRVIPVLDLLDGQVVRGVAGQREQYRPIVSQLSPSSLPIDIAAAFVTQFGFRTAYVADLDAIERRGLSRIAWQAVSAAGLDLLLDAGIGTLSQAQEVESLCMDLSTSVSQVIGLESLESFDALDRIAEFLGPERIVFSLDLKQGRPLCRGDESAGLSAVEIASRAVRAGVRQMIVLDLAGVGVGQGIPTLALCGEILARHPKLSLISGGGVRGVDDLHALADAGCDAALVASALHDGRLTPAQLEAYAARR